MNIIQALALIIVGHRMIKFALKHWNVKKGKIITKKKRIGITRKIYKLISNRFHYMLDSMLDTQYHKLKAKKELKKERLKQQSENNVKDDVINANEEPKTSDKVIRFKEYKLSQTNMNMNLNKLKKAKEEA